MLCSLQNWSGACCPAVAASVAGAASVAAAAAVAGIVAAADDAGMRPTEQKQS